MSWRDTPEVRGLAEYCERFGIAYAVLFGVDRKGASYHVVTYGKNARLCDAARRAGAELAALVDESDWPSDAAMQGERDE